MQGRNSVEAILICFDNYGLIRLNVLDLDLSINDYRSGLIGDATVDTGEFSLGERSAGKREAAEEDRHTEKQRGENRKDPTGR